MFTTKTIRLQDEVNDRLDNLAEATQRSESVLASESIRLFVENNEWQIGEIKAALKEADAGDFASHKQVAELARKWKAIAGYSQVGACHSVQPGTPDHAHHDR